MGIRPSPVRLPQQTPLDKGMGSDRKDLRSNGANISWYNRWPPRWSAQPHSSWFSRSASNRGNQLTFDPQLVVRPRQAPQLAPSKSHLNSHFSVSRLANGNPISNRRRTAYRHANLPLGIPGSQWARPGFVGSGGVPIRPRREGRSSVGTGRRISLGRWGWRAQPAAKFSSVQIHVGAT